MKSENEHGVALPEHDETGEKRFLHLIDMLPKVSVQGYDKNRRVIYWNQSSVEIYGYEKEEAIGRKLEELIIPDEMVDDVIAFHTAWINQGAAIPSSELLLKHKDGRRIPVFSSHIMLQQQTDHPEMFCIDIDLSEEYAAREKLKVIANTDLLTNLPNRRYLEDALARVVGEKGGSDNRFAIFFIDLDMFKEVNDTLGHTWGDKLLKTVAERLESNLRPQDTLVRFGGDEFVLLMPDLESSDAASAVAGNIISLFQHSFSIDSENVYITASIGISLYPQDGREPEDLLKNADTAMYFAKETGRNRFHFFTDELSQKLQTHRKISTRLHRAIQNNELELVYQPQFNMNNQRVIACEALLRWYPDADEDPIPPDIFIPIAERSDLILFIGEWVLDQACAQASAWKKAGFNIRVDINVSGKQLEQADFFCMLDGYRERYGLAPEDLGIEITEHVLIKSNERIMDGLRAQRDKGVEISIDDFGTGYSSLNYLKTFPITILKIDREFVMEAPENELDGALLEAIVNVGHKLRFDIVVEGVETDRQAEFCRNLEIDYAQGYWYCRPVSADEAAAFFSRDE